METVWMFETARFRVTLAIEDSPDLYDGDDKGGKIQRKIDSGEYRMFDSIVRVVDKETGAKLGADSLGASVYASRSVDEFWTAHWDSPARYRNTLRQKARKRVICHYFPDMVRTACREARKALRELQTVKVRVEAN